MVDVFLHTADNTDITELARLYWRPPVREAGEADDKYVIGTEKVKTMYAIEKELKILPQFISPKFIDGFHFPSGMFTGTWQTC